MPNLEIVEGQTSGAPKFAFSAINLYVVPETEDRHFFSPINICRVPEKFRKVNEDAFSPRLVSIGPYYHGKSHLKGMEAYKRKCYKRFEKNHGSEMIELIFNDISKAEKIIMDSYEDNFDSKDKFEFPTMMMLDAIFILELFFETTSDAKPDDQGNNKGKKAIDDSDARSEERNSKGKSSDEDSATRVIFELEWMKNEIMHDMLLLDNQIPWYVLSICLTHCSTHTNNPWFDHFSALIKYFKIAGITCPPKLLLEQTIYTHFIEMLWASVRPESSQQSPSRSGRPEYIRTASELQEAGVEFISGGGTMTDIHFLNGKLTIPQLTLNEWTETLFRNLIAYEHCEYGVEKYVTSYVIFMDSLIDTPADVDILKSSKIFVNFLIDSQQVADLFNNLHKEILKDSREFYLAKQCEDLNEYRRNTKHRIKAWWFRSRRTLRRDYFNTPWAGVAVFAAFLAILLTLVQAVCSVIPLVT